MIILTGGSGRRNSNHKVPTSIVLLYIPHMYKGPFIPTPGPPTSASPPPAAPAWLKAVRKGSAAGKFLHCTLAIYPCYYFPWISAVINSLIYYIFLCSAAAKVKVAVAGESSSATTKLKPGWRLIQVNGQAVTSLQMAVESINLSKPSTSKPLRLTMLPPVRKTM
eukprot:SAG31_NODE_1851_length_7077_cov_2.680854_7_plen_165_part_00